MPVQPVTGVTPAILKWARESANMTLAAVADRLKKDVEVIAAWEAGEAAPTYPQLETLAYDVYKRPLALFFLPAPPEEPRPRAEFRSLPDVDLSLLDRDTVLLIRKARGFQTALIELYGERNPVADPIWRAVRVDPRGNLAAQAAQVRAALGVDLAAIRGQPDEDAALKLWRRAIEAQGVHVFKESFDQRELSGFCLWHPEFPVIMINNSTTKTRQVFSLLHELAHLLCDRSGISRFDDRGIDQLPAADQAIERFCNALAAEVLVPAAEFARATQGLDPRTATDAEFSAVARQFHVSRSVVLRRFMDRNVITRDFYLAKDEEWTQQIRERGGAGGNYYNTQAAYLSEQFLREVVSRYTRRLLSRTEAADLIGVKPKQFGQFEDMVLRGAAA
jgi:Zn-dependent peptidase ImmA (M78 family)